MSDQPKPQPQLVAVRRSQFAEGMALLFLLASPFAAVVGGAEWAIYVILVGIWFGVIR